MYLHEQDPPIIHRDLKCENIFVKGEDGSIKIGDLGLSTQAARAENSTLSVLGTPQFMAPELYDENTFRDGGCLCVWNGHTQHGHRETHTYSECLLPMQVYKKVSKGIMPEVLDRVMHAATRDFILFCLNRKEDGTRPSALEVSQHPFLSSTEDDI